MPASEQVVSTPPYVSFSTLTGWIEEMHKTTLPAQIDRTVMRKMSGVVQSHLISALRFLKLINDTNHVQPALRELVKAYGEAGWAERMGEVVVTAYLDILEGVDLDHGTQKQLFDAFKARGQVDGEMLDKAVRFYIKAMESGNMTLSPHFTARRQRTAKMARAPRNGGRAGESVPVAPSTPAPNAPPPNGTISFTIHIPGKIAGQIIVPENISEDDCEMISAMMPVVAAYAKRRSATTD